MANWESITDQLHNIYNYAFVETAPYGFFVPKRDKYVAVHLKQKLYHCLHCSKELVVQYKDRGVVYFSKERFEKQRQMYEKRALPFLTKTQLKAEEAFVYHEEGYCVDCAAQLADTADGGQLAYHKCRELHTLDERLVETAREITSRRVKAWLEGITEAAQLAAYDLSTEDGIRNIICAAVLNDTSELKAALEEYKKSSRILIHEIRDRISRLDMSWEVYAARPTYIYESMSDEIYHEYTVIFPIDETEKQEFFVKKLVDKARIVMFIEQPRVSNVDELLLEAGYLTIWGDWFYDHVMKLEK